MGSDAMRWEENVLQVPGKTFVKYQIVEYVTETSRITKQKMFSLPINIYLLNSFILKGWSLNFIYTVFFIADYFYSHRSFRWNIIAYNVKNLNR